VSFDFAMIDLLSVPVPYPALDLLLDIGMW